MSTTIGIDVEVNTGAGVQAMRDLEAATREVTTAADNAGEGQKTLAQRTADAREKQLAAAEAVRRANAALAEHSATVAAHGRESKEAAASLARLKAAQAEAAKQAAVADKAIAAVATETARAVREADKLTPALARVERELKSTSSAAERSASDVRKLELAIVAAEKGQRGWSATMASFAGNLGAGAVAFGLEKFKDGIKWAAEHNAEFGGTLERLIDTATVAGEALLNGPIGKGLTYITGLVADGIGLFVDLGEAIGLLEREVVDTEAALVAYAKANDGTLGPLAQMAKQTLLTAAAQDRLNESIRVGQRVREEEARKEYVLAGQAARDAREREARQRQAQGRQAHTETATATLEARRGGGQAETPEGKPLDRGVSDAAGVDASSKLAEQAEARRLKELEKFEKAQSAIEAREQKRREKQLEAALEREEELLQERQERVERVTDVVLELGGGLVDGIERAMNGEKFAIASALEETLRAVAKKNAILALEQGALAIAAAASYNYPKAAQHGIAAGLHVGVAVAAGVGAHVAGNVAGGASSSSSGGGGSGGSSRGGSSGSSGGGGDGLEAQEVPISHEQLRRADASGRGSAASGSGGVQVTINNPTIVGAGGMREVAAIIRKEIARQDRGGSRPRT